MPQKHNSFVLGAARAAKKTFYILTFSGWNFFQRFSTKFLTYYQFEEVLRHIEFTREMLKDQLHLLKLNFAKM
jgi:hypothetical protein